MQTGAPQRQSADRTLTGSGGRDHLPGARRHGGRCGHVQRAGVLQFWTQQIRERAQRGPVVRDGSR
eukprot:6293088-Pyramimonas_sp.AAC.1